MLDQLTSRQLSEWEAYDKLDPVGDWRIEFVGAKLESLISNLVNVLYAKKGHTPTMTTALDFMPDWTGERQVEQKKQSPEEMKKILMGMVANQNKKAVRDKQPPIKKTKQ